MSLVPYHPLDDRDTVVPYHPPEDREIVLRHDNALVVRNRISQRLEIQRLTECPTCHRSLHGRKASPERDRSPYDVPGGRDSFVSPNYFRLLQAGFDSEPTSATPEIPHVDRPPSSPVRRITHPTHQTPHVEAEGEDANDGGLGWSNPFAEPQAPATGRVSDDAHQASRNRPREGSHEGARIRKRAFSPNYFRDFFTEERELGRGGKGVVLLVCHELDGVKLGHYACKRVPVGDDHAWLEKVLVEVELLANLSHPNLVSYRHVWLEEVQLNRFGPPVPCAFILQQYCNGGDLLQYVVGAQPKEATKEDLKAKMRRRSRGQAERPQGLSPPGQRRLSFEEIHSIFRDITSGLAFLHDSSYVHRDLKPSNCLLHRQGKTVTCLISDFGEVQQAKAMRNSTGSTGTISYCAPEVLTRDARGRFGNFTTKSDIFSLGMILYFLCFGRLPYRSANAVQEELEDVELLRAEIVDWKGFQDERRERPDLPAKLYHLLKRLLSINPNERPSAQEVLSAIKYESGLDGVPRAQASASPASLGLGLSGRRIRNLDSPTPPSTLVADPHKRPSHQLGPSGLAVSRESCTSSADTAQGSEESRDTSDSPQPTRQNSIQKHGNPVNTSRHRPPAMAASHSHDGHSRSPPGGDGDEDSPHVIAPASLPLLMPPPFTPLERAGHQLVVAWHHLSQFLARNTDLVAFVVRLVLFSIKMASLSRPCWPLMADLAVGAPLVAIAAMDLGIPATATSTPAHHRPSIGSVGGSSPMPSPHIAGARRQHEEQGSVAFRFKWGWRVSASLVAIHFLVLWTALLGGKLCARTAA